MQYLFFWPLRKTRKSLTSYKIPQLHSFVYIFHFLYSWIEFHFIYEIYLHYPFISSGICKLTLSLFYCEWTWMWMYLLAGCTIPHYITPEMVYLDHMRILFFNCLGNTQRIFHHGYTVYTSTTVSRILLSSHPYHHMLSFIFLIVALWTDVKWGWTIKVTLISFPWYQKMLNH